MIIFNKRSHLKKEIVDVIEAKDTPQTIYYKQSVTSPKYKVTIEMIDEDYIIDDLGKKWIRAKEEEETEE